MKDKHQPIRGREVAFQQNSRMKLWFKKTNHNLDLGYLMNATELNSKQQSAEISVGKVVVPFLYPC